MDNYLSFYRLLKELRLIIMPLQHSAAPQLAKYGELPELLSLFIEEIVNRVFLHCFPRSFIFLILL